MRDTTGRSGGREVHRRSAVRVRRVANLVNGSTLLGLVVARVAAERAVPYRDGLWLAGGYRPRFPLAGAFTIGDVVIVRAPRETVQALDRSDPRLLDHEARHATQYACCLGLPFLPLYGAAAGWSWLRCRDWWSRNWFERRAGLSDGGYRENPVVWPRVRVAG